MARPGISIGDVFSLIGDDVAESVGRAALSIVGNDRAKKQTAILAGRAAIRVLVFAEILTISDLPQ